MLVPNVDDYEHAITQAPHISGNRGDYVCLIRPGTLLFNSDERTKPSNKTHRSLINLALSLFNYMRG